MYLQIIYQHKALQMPEVCFNWPVNKRDMAPQREFVKYRIRNTV